MASKNVATPSEASMAADGSFSQYVHDLPRELFDTIYDLVFTPEPGPHIINKTYKPPVQLHINRATRKAFADAYYGGVFHLSAPARREAADKPDIQINDVAAHEDIDTQPHPWFQRLDPLKESKRHFAYSRIIGVSKCREMHALAADADIASAVGQFIAVQMRSGLPGTLSLEKDGFDELERLSTLERARVVLDVPDGYVLQPPAAWCMVLTFEHKQVIGAGESLWSWSRTREA